ncbi:hypothetical protein A2U01_0095145, partial [Trifolium medium]|nr:hypothetical protein [Trifolium medium]
GDPCDFYYGLLPPLDNGALPDIVGREQGNQNRTGH